MTMVLELSGRKVTQTVLCSSNPEVDDVVRPKRLRLFDFHGADEMPRQNHRPAAGLSAYPLDIDLAHLAQSLSRPFGTIIAAPSG